MFLADMPQLQVHILVQQEQLEEYDDEDAVPAKDHRTKYIEAEPGHNFTVRVMTNPQMAKVPQDCVAAHVYFDGKHVGGATIDTGDRYANQWVKQDGHGRNTATGSTYEKYRFASLETNDGPVGKAKQADYTNLGEVEVRCYWIRKTGGSREHTRHYNPFQESAASIPEKCLKGRAISSRASLGPAEQRGRKIKYMNQEYPYSTSAFAKFTFKCRSRRDLQIMGVIPRSPSPAPLEERDPDTLTLEESRELVRRLQQQREQQQQQRIEIKKEGQKSKKRERSETIQAESDDEAVLITGERPAQKRSRQSTDSGVEIVDLTEE